MLVATGGLIGYFSGHAHTFGVDRMAVFDVLGTLFVGALRMLVAPLVISSAISGVASLSSARDLGRRYKHFVYAPGLVAGYGATTLPGMREAIEGDRWDEANRYAALTAAVLVAYCERLDAAKALLKSDPHQVKRGAQASTHRVSACCQMAGDRDEKKGISGRA